MAQVTHDGVWTSKEQGANEKEQEQEQEQEQLSGSQTSRQEGKGNTILGVERDFEGGFGGQEDLEDRYATTSGEH